MIDIFLIILLLGIAGAVIFYLVRSKKNGTVCIGCPHASSCGSKKNTGKAKTAASSCACGCCHTGKNE